MINYEMNGDVAILQMDDGKANVFSKAMSQSLSELLSRAETEAKATVLTGREGQFSAGYDLSVMQSGDPIAMAEMVIAGFEVLCQFAKHPQPLIAACNGNAMGIGAFLLLTADTRLAIDQESKICLPETKAGMKFPGILVAAAQGRLNPAKYVEAALQSKTYNPTTAVEAGFIDHVVPAAEFDATVMATATALAQLPTQAYGRNKADLQANKLNAMTASLAEIKANPALLAS